MKAGKKGKIIAGVFMIVLGLVWIFPIVFLLLSSLKTDADFITSFSNLKGPVDYLSRIWPQNTTAVNYVELFVGGAGANTTANIPEMFKNSFIVSISVTVLVVFITSLSAYAYERLHFPGGNAIFWTLMCISMFPNAVNILPMFRIMSALGWVNNLNALIWPGIVGVFNIFLLRNFLRGIPRAFDEAARIDGANSLQIYARVIVPSIRPVMIVVALFAFNASWNDFLWPTIVMTDVSRQTLTPGLRLLMGQYEQKWAHMIASCLVSMIPPLLLYLVAQRYFLQGISIGSGIKG